MSKTPVTEKLSPKGHILLITNKASQTESIEKTTMSTSLLSSIEKLRGRENYATWKFSIENYLALEDLSECLTSADASKDAKKDAKAKSAIILSIEKHNYVHVTAAKTAKEAWTSLKTTFEDNGAVRKVTLMRKIVNTKLIECNSMEVYVTEIISTAQRLNEIGFTVGDEWLVYKSVYRFIVKTKIKNKTLYLF